MTETPEDRSGYEGLVETLRWYLGVDLTEDQLAAFRWYSRELQLWNRKVNLTAITDPREIEVKHFVDSLTPLKVMDRAGKLVDVGTGAGFPGIPLKIACPQLRVLLVESTRKKTEFCQHVIDGLGLTGIQAQHARAEDLAQEPERRSAFDWAVGRAVASLSVLGEYLLPFLKVGGRMIAMKGETGPAEAHEGEDALRLLGGEIQRLVPIELPTVAETRYLVVVDKVSATPAEYPRRAGIPSKRPLAE